MTLKHKALGLTFLILVLAVLAAPTSSGVVQTACADGSCTCGCPPNVCWDETLQKFIICDCAPGGSNPPNPTPAPTQVSTSPPGGQPTSPPPGTPPPGGTPGPTQPPSTPMPTPTPPPSGAYVIFHCAPWPECPEGWADVTALLGRDGNWYVVEVDCLEESACVLPTPTPGAEPPGGGGDDFPCDEPPELDGGILRQDCSQWPGWEICAEVTIAPAAVLRNPWPRSLVGMPTQLWFTGAGEPEVFSDERALACPGVDYGATYDASTFDCGGPVGQVTEGAQVNVQIGAAWRRWTRDMPPLFGHVPPDEVVWVVQDREWSGGMRVATGDHLVHTFETSSWGLPADGPTWNPECQEETCGYDERVSDYLGAESYHVLIQTWWWPEWTFRYDEYFCAQSDWGACWGPYPPPGYPVGVPSRPCDHDGDGQDDPGYYQEQSCSGWRWRRVTEPMDCPEGRLNPDTGWCRYDLRDLGGDPLAGSTGVIVAGADTSGVRQGSWTDRWPHYIPVPVLEIQPVAPH